MLEGIFNVQLGKVTVWKGMHLKSSTYRFNNFRLIYDCQNICKKFSGLKFGLKLGEHDIYQINWDRTKPLIDWFFAVNHSHYLGKKK